MRTGIHKGLQHILAVLRSMIFIGISIQIVLGLIWMCSAFPAFQEFGESYLYVEISKTLVCDEYTGILYPLLLGAARGVEWLLRIPYYMVMYPVQLFLALYAGCKFLNALGAPNKYWRLWGSLGLVTIPMAMQNHMAILPQSFVGSLLLLQLSILIYDSRGRGEKGLRPLAQMSLLWLLCALLLPEYLFLGGIIPFCCLARGLAKDRRESRRRLWHKALFILAFGGMAAGILNLTQVEGSYGRVHKSLSATLYSRIGWSSISDTLQRWPEGMLDIVGLERARATAQGADNIARILGPALEETVGEEGAKAYFRAAARQAWEYDYRRILHEIAWDAAGYTVSPIVLQLQLTGRGYDSYSGANYDIMRSNRPELTAAYVDYSCWWFAVGLGLMALWLCGCFLHVTLFGEQKSGGRKTASAWGYLQQPLGVLVPCAVLGGCVTLWYTMSGGGMMDYKNSILINYLWTAGLMALTLPGKDAFEI